MSYDTEAPRGFLIAGQADGTVEEWLDPFFDLEEIDSIITNANQYDIDIPWKDCTTRTRIFRQLTASGDHIETVLDLIRDHPALELDWDSYGEDDDMPGRSGSFLMVLVRKDRAKSFQVQIGRLRDSLLEFWEASGGWGREIDERTKREQDLRRQEEAERKAERKRAVEANREKKQTFQTLVSTLSGKIMEYQASSAEPYLHPDCTKRVLCVKNGPVYILVHEPYDSEENEADAHELADRLEETGISVQRLKQYQPEDVGYIMAMNIAGRNKYRGWLQQNGILTSDDPQIVEEATKHRALFLELRKRAAG